MSTFLELVTAVHRECDVAGNPPSSVLNQTGMYKKLVEWTADADYEIQAHWGDWNFLWSQWSESTIIGTAQHTAPVDLGAWDRESFYLDFDTNSFKKLRELNYRTWRSSVGPGSYVAASSKPDYFIVEPNNGIRLHPAPDAVYTLSADYWAKPTRLSANTSTSVIPVEFERAIIGLAKMKYAEDQGAGIVLANAQAEHMDWMDRLMAAELPGQEHRRLASPPPMTVIVE